MLFTELRFVAFFAIAFGVHWMLKRNAARKNWLLACSWAFYAAWDWRFLSLILVSTLIDHFAGRGIHASGNGRVRRAWLGISLAGNLGILGFFKYFNFFVESAADLMTAVGLPLSPATLDIVLPVGISFYTFQTLSYSIDIFRGNLRPARSLRDLALFVAFFPQLVAGPIVRASHFLPQLASTCRFGNVPWRSCFALFLAGFLKKACVADNIAALIDPVFAQPALYGVLDTWLSAALYVIQVYCDFSGYSDMAIATAGMLGYDLALNFDFPYVARSITDVWRRWHISLTTWFRDYLYIPLGGNRRGPARVAFNLIAVFVLCGLWHGARWNYVVFGLYNGVFLMLERARGQRRAAGKRACPAWLAHGYTMLVWLLGLVLFRTVDLSSAGAFFARMVGAAGSTAAEGATIAPLWWAGVALFGLVHWLGSRRDWLDRLPFLPAWGYSLAYGTAVALLLPWAASDYQPFIYFQF